MGFFSSKRDGKPKPPKEETYEVYARCSNCRREVECKIPKGIPIKEGLVRKECPDCGVPFKGKIEIIYEE